MVLINEKGRHREKLQLYNTETNDITYLMLKQKLDVDSYFVLYLCQKHHKGKHNNEIRRKYAAPVSMYHVLQACPTHRCEQLETVMVLVLLGKYIYISIRIGLFVE